MQHTLILVGGGSGAPEYLLPVVQKAMEQADWVIASQRLASLVPPKKLHLMGKIETLLEQLPQLVESRQLCILVSGDPLLYSLCRSIRQRYPDMEMELLPGIGAMQLLGAAFGRTMEEAAVVSLHGRTSSPGKIAFAVSQHKMTCFFCSNVCGPKEIANALIRYGMDDVQLFVGSDLGTETQQLWQGTPASWQGENPALCVAAVENPYAKPWMHLGLLPDRAFVRRENVPMTKEEVRAVILSKLQLQPDSVVWDLGAGTGSVSVECARMCPMGTVYGVEYKADAVAVLEENKKRFGVDNLEIIHGRAEACLGELPAPDCVFLGGSGGAGEAILRRLMALPHSLRLVVSAVTLETQAALYPLVAQMREFEAVQVAVSRGKAVGKYHILDGGHPVMLLCGETGGENR